MPRIGILGGGQLAQMLTQAAINLGLETAIYDRSPDTPASRLTQVNAVGTWGDTDALRTFARTCDVLTLENEFVDAGPLVTLAAENIPIYPKPATLGIIQDKLQQKQVYQAAGLAVPPFRAVASPDDLRQAADDFGFPLVLKARYGGYDGYGNATLRSPDDIPAAWDKLAQRETRGLLVEAFVPFVRELAVMVLRTRSGEIRTYPVVETIQQNHICHLVRCPAPISPDLAQQTADLAARAVEQLDGVGIFGVELFQLPDDTILLNEIAPRVHNSGHYTIEACVTSQFENHLRAVLGLPPGSTALRAPAAVMVNLLGERSGPVDFSGVAAALAVEGASLHLYGKQEVRPGRKLGHITALAATVEAAEAIALRAAALVRL